MQRINIPSHEEFAGRLLRAAFFLDNKFVLEICIWIYVSMFKLFVAQEARISVLGEND